MGAEVTIYGVLAKQAGGALPPRPGCPMVPWQLVLTVRDVYSRNIGGAHKLRLKMGFAALLTRFSGNGTEDD